ncbi:MAG: choice-of-anchor Q domain-containing protein, partial [Melioribacteraceae bacterium]|nr:choice-of-anchor Q domain-containing protein [Melioribacteraceae bacterium]
FELTNSKTYNLLSTSPAINKGNSLLSITGMLDASNNPRIQDQVIDIGAYEYQGATVNPTVPITEPIPEPITDPIINPIGHDGTIDWNKVVSIAEGTSNVKSLKVVQSENAFQLKVEGTLLEQKGQFYFNTDNNVKTGFQMGYWTTSGVEYMVENGVLYQYTGSGGTEWSWKEVAKYKGTKAYSQTTSAIELSVPYTDIKISPTSIILIGYIWNDSKSDLLPAGTLKESVSISPTSELAPTASVVTEPTTSIKIDGLSSDWSQLSSARIGDSQLKTLKTFSTSNYLYMLLQGGDFTKRVQIYLNSDNNSKTGFKLSKFSQSGAEYLIENGTLYKYTGDGSSWSWVKLKSLKFSNEYVSNSNSIEIGIYLNDVLLKSNSTISFGIVIANTIPILYPTTGQFQVISISN